MTLRRELKIIIFFLAKRKKIFFLMIGIMLLCAILESLSVALFFPLFSTLQGIKETDSGALFTTISNFLIGLINIDNKLIALSFIVFTVFLLSQCAAFINKVLSSWWRYSLTREIQNELFQKYMHAPYSYFIDRKQGEFVYNCYNAPSNASQIWLLVPNLIVAMLTTIGISSVLMSLQYQFALILIVISILFGVLIKYIAKNMSIVYGQERLVSTRTQTELISEAVSGIRQIKTFLLDKLWANKFAKAVDDFVTVAQKDSIVNALPPFLVSICGIGIVCFMVVMMVHFYDEEKRLVVLPLAGVFAIAIQRVLPASSGLGNTRLQIVGILPNLDLLYKELNRRIEVEDAGNIPFQALAQGIKLKGVSFAYNGKDHVFQDLNLFIEKGKTTVIVGSSGAGKSTLIDILMRMYPVEKGAILVDDIDMYALKRNDWLNRIGFVSQDTFVFNATIEENIKAGKKGTTDSEMIKAAKFAFADEFISEMPNGYDTVVGDRGLKLSGGQRQRIAIARALIRNPEIIILDEATSALDSISEKKIKKSISQIGKSKTIIIAAHRLTTVQDADYIYVLDDGRIVEQGTHESLFQKRGYYWNLYRVQKEASGIS